MRDFFRGWKRKVGCVTVLLSSMFFLPWVRSFYLQDYITIEDTVNVYDIESNFGILYMTISTERDPGLVFHWSSHDLFIPNDRARHLAIDWRLKTLAFDVGAGRGKYGPINLDRVWWIDIPLWAIVIPLSLLSAWLLLSTPRQKSNPQSVPNHA